MKKTLLLICFFPFLIGCATVVHGTRQEIPVTSEPSEANVNVDGVADYKTPATLKLERGFDHLLTISKEGFKTEVVRIMHIASDVVMGNIFFGGLIGWGIDAMTGAQYELYPGRVHVVLQSMDYTGGPPVVQHQVKIGNPVEYYNRGNDYFYKGQYDLAIEEYTKAIELDPNNIHTYKMRGNAYDKKGQHELAISDYNKAIEINPKYARVYIYKAITCESLGLKEEALRCYERFIEYASGDDTPFVEKAKQRIKLLQVQSQII